MNINENKIIFDPSSSQQKKMNIKHILLSQSNNDFLPSRQKRKYFQNRKSSFDKKRTRINLNTQSILSKSNNNNNKTQEEIQQQQQSRQQHVKSGLIYSRRKQILSTQKINHLKKTTTNSVTNSSVIFKRRVNSESKVQQISKTMKYQQHSFDGNEKQSKSISKINFTNSKKFIQDLKKATTFIKMKPRNNINNNHRYQVIKDNNNTSSYSVSKSFDNHNHNNNNVRVSQQNSRQRLMEKSIQKLKPSFNINQVKFYSSTKKILRKQQASHRQHQQSHQKQQSHQQQQKKQSTINRNRIKSRPSNSKIGKQKQKQVQSKSLTLSQITTKNQQILLKVIKHTQQPLETYSKFIKGSLQQKQYKINVNYLLQYSKQQQQQQTQKEQTNHQRQRIERNPKHNYLSQIDFSALKLLSSIYLCLIETLNKLLLNNNDRQSSSSSSKKQLSNSINNNNNINNKDKDINQQIQVIKQYIEVYFHTYSRMKAQYIICEVVFDKLKNRLYAFFILQRVMFYYLHENVQQFIMNTNTKNVSKTIYDDLPSIIQFVQMSEDINKTLLNMLHQEIVSCSHNSNLKKSNHKNNNNSNNNKVQDDNETTKKGEKIVDTFRTLRLMKEIQKRLPKLRDIVDNVVINRCGGKQAHKCNENIIKDAVLSLMAQAQNIEKDHNPTNILQIYQLQQYFNWTLMTIPPLFYLPPQPSRPYTLVIDLDGTLIYYDQQTKILKYRPYMDKFLTTMKKYFQLVLFSSHPKQRTDIIVQQIQRDEQMFQYRLYRQHMVFQQGGLRKNVGYLGRSVQRVILIDDEQRNTQWLPLNSHKIPTFTGDKKDKQLLAICDWLGGKIICYYCLALIQTQPGDIRGKLKQKSTSLDQVIQVDQVSSTIQASIQYCDDYNQTTTIRQMMMMVKKDNNKVV